MFPFLRIGGTWRPFFERDRVLLWLDATSWLPLRTVVYPSSGRERREWELRYGRTPEEPETPILDVRLASMSDDRPSRRCSGSPGAPAPDPTRLDEVPARLGYRPGNARRAGRPRARSRSRCRVASSAFTPSSLLVYAEGLDYVRIGERRDWTGPGPFGPVDSLAQRVRLAGGGVGYYEPAGEGYGRRLAIHTETADLFLETNLSRDRVAGDRGVAAGPRATAAAGVATPGSLPVSTSSGSALPRRSRRRAFRRRSPNGCRRATSSRAPSSPGSGSAIEGVTLYLRQRDTDAAGRTPDPARRTREGAAAVLRPAAEGSDRSGVDGRWTPSRSQLEWVDEDAYHSLQGELGLRALVAFANAISGTDP